MKMEPIRYSDVLRATAGTPAGQVDGDPLITDVSIDSRHVQPGSLFVPIRGRRYDAHEFISEAFLGGASFSLVARDANFARMPANTIVVKDTTQALGDLARWHRSRFEVPVIGITGSCGKTTVKEMVRLVLGEDVVASPASYNNDIGVPLTLLQMDAKTRACVVEIGTSLPGEIAALANIARPTVGVLTNVEEAHLEGLGTVRGVMREKAALLEALPDDGVAIVNADNYYCREIMEEIGSYLVTFGTWEDADVYGIDPQATPGGVGFHLYGRMPFEIPAYGMHNVSNALAAVAVGLWLDQDPMEVRSALMRYVAPPMRMSRDRVGDILLINDAYNANPRSMDEAIRELRVRDCAGRRVAVLGEMLELGDESERCHRSLGRKVANEGIDMLWAVGPSAHLVAEEARRFGMAKDAVCAHEHVEDAINAPAFMPGSGDSWMFKASRGVALEHLLEHVREMAKAADPAGGMYTTGPRS